MKNTQHESGAVGAAQSETADLSLFAVGSIIGITFRTLFKNPIVFFGLTFLAGVLGVITKYGLNAMIPGIEESPFDFLQHFIGFLFGQWIGGAIAYGVYQTLKEQGASLRASLFHGMRCFIPLVCVGFLYSLGIFFGMMLFIVPGIILMCTWVVAVPVCVVEKLSARESLSRSKELTKGCRMKISGLYSVMFIISVVITIIVATIAAMLLVPYVGAGMRIILANLIGLIPLVFLNIMPAIIYYELRRVKEGVTVDSLANVFD